MGRQAASIGARAAGGDAPAVKLWSVRRRSHAEGHRQQRVGWLRAAVLGANDGIVSTASLLMGVAAAQAPGGGREPLLVAGVAALVAGAMSMAAGEYVSVSSQADTEQADLAQERAELAAPGDQERDELAGIYVQRGLDPDLALEVARQLMAHDALGAHARDELGITDLKAARPVQAAWASAAAFTSGASLPLAVAAVAPGAGLMPAIAGWSLLSLCALGAVSARAGGAPVGPAVARVAFWGAFAMAITWAIGRWFGTVVG